MFDPFHHGVSGDEPIVDRRRRRQWRPSVRCLSEGSLRVLQKYIDRWRRPWGRARVASVRWEGKKKMRSEHYENALPRFMSIGVIITTIIIIIPILLSSHVLCIVQRGDGRVRLVDRPTMVLFICRRRHWQCSRNLPALGI